jgi:glycogen synthase
MTGGEGVYTYGLAKALSDLGHNVTVITAGIGKRMENLNENFEIIRITPIKKTGLKSFSFNLRAIRKLNGIYNMGLSTSCNGW